MGYNQTHATPIVKTKCPAIDSRDFKIKLDSTGRLLGLAGNTLKLWFAEVNNGTLPYLATIGGDFTGIHSFDFSPKNDKVAAGYNNHGIDYLGVWDTYQLEDGEPKLLVKKNLGPVVSMQFNPSGQYLLCGQNQGPYGAEIWDLTQIENEEPKEVVFLGYHDTGVATVTIYSMGKKLSVVYSGNALIWNMDAVLGGNTAPVAVMKHNNIIVSVNPDPEGHYILTASDDYTTKLWDSSQIKDTTPSLLATMKHQCPVYQALFSPDKNRILTSSTCEVKLWDTRTVKEDGRATLLNTFNTDGSYQKIELDPAGIWMLTVNSKAAELWDIATLEPDPESETE